MSLSNVQDKREVFLIKKLCRNYFLKKWNSQKMMIMAKKGHAVMANIVITKIYTKISHLMSILMKMKTMKMKITLKA